MDSRHVLLLAWAVVFVGCVQGEGSADAPPPDPTTTTTPAPAPGPSSTTIAPPIDCSNYNASCDKCVKNPQCLWCTSDPVKCIPYPVGQIIPSSSVCKLSNARWGVCWVNYEVLLIVMGVVAGVILLSLGCCVYCCCCRNSSDKRFAREDARLERERSDRRARNDERRAERQSRMDDIRAKYGLGGNNYRRFDNEVA